jgi:AcrR family transcriptional regulator
VQDVALGPLPAEAAAGGEARRRLFEVALELFGERGYANVTVRDLLGRLDQHGSALYGHVDSKQHLLFELIRIGHTAHLNAVRRALINAPTEPVEQLRAMTRAHVVLHATYPLLSRVANRELNALAPEQLAVVLVIRGETEQLFAEVIDRGVRLGAFTDTDPRLPLAAVGAMGIRVAEWWQPETGIALDTLADTYADYAVRLVR